MRETPTSRYHAAARAEEPPSVSAISAFASAEEARHRTDELVGLLVGQHVAGVADQLDARLGDQRLPALGVSRHEQSVGRPPQDEALRGEAIQALREAPVRDRKQDLARHREPPLTPDVELLERLHVREVGAAGEQRLPLLRI